MLTSLATPGKSMTTFFELMDVSVAVNAMCSAEQRLFVTLWGHGYSTNDLADTFGIAENAVRQKKKRITSKIARYLNGELSKLSD
ncbi:hypothetical protein V7161_26935 [Neobacillus drentensis]|uniref:hypothetical protein n=1 Tax=Neobacillus drentensis TaxID=220684 RepID=UPI00300133E2